VEEGQPSISVEMMHMSTGQCGSGFPSAQESPYSKWVIWKVTRCLGIKCWFWRTR